MANEDIQNRLSHLNLRNLCLEIGYEKESPTRDSDALKAEVKEFLKEYESHGHTIPPCGRADPIEARLCATSFLEEDGRGERLFPPNPEGVAIWPINRALIVEAVTHIFRLRAFNNKQLKDQKARKIREIEEIDNVTQKRPRRSGENIAYFQDNELYQPDIVESSPDLPLPTNLNALDPAHYLKPWHEDPERLDRRAAISHIKDLNPLKRQQVIPEFTHEWLSKGLPWPPSADPILAQFMHQRNFYVTSELKLGTYREVVDKLRSNTQLSSLNGPQYQKLERRVGERIKHLTAEFYSGCFLQTEPDGSSTRTKRFQQLWESREEHWKVDREATATGEDGHKVKRRKRSTKPPAGPKSPIIFPNIAIPPEVKIRDDLKSMAGSVLEHLNISAKTEDPIEEYVVITPKPSPVAVPSEKLLPASESTPAMFSLDDTQMPYVPPVHEEAPSPVALPHLVPAPLIPKDLTPKIEYGVFSKPGDTVQSPRQIAIEEPIDSKAREDYLMQLPSPELNHSTLNSSSNHYDPTHDPTHDHSCIVNQRRSPPKEFLHLPSLLLNEHTRIASTRPPPSPDKSVSVPELKNDYEIWCGSSGLYQLCLKHGLKEFPSLSEKVQTELWGLDVWLHPETTSDFTLRNFCSKHSIPGGVAQYKEWWTLQNETERNKRLHPNQRAPNGPSQNPSPIQVLAKSPSAGSNAINRTTGFHASGLEATENLPSTQQQMGPIEHHHHYISRSPPRKFVSLDTDILNGGEHQSNYAKLEHEVKKLELLSQKPGGIPQFTSEQELSQFLMAHSITEWGFRYWEERYRRQSSQAVVDRSSVRENIPIFNSEATFMPLPQKPMSPEFKHSQPPPKQLASPQEWAKMTQQSTQVPETSHTNMQSSSPNPSRNLLPKVQSFTPAQWSPPDANTTSGVKQNFTPVSQTRTFVVQRKQTKKREKRVPPYAGEQLSGPTRSKIQYLISPNSDRSNSVWREVVNIPGLQPAQQIPPQQHMTFPSHHQATHHHSHPGNNPQYMPPMKGPPKIDTNTYSIPQPGSASNPNMIFPIPQPTPSNADPITPSRTPSPTKLAELTRRSFSQDTPSMRPSVLPQVVPELRPSLYSKSSPTPSQTYPPTPSTIGPSPLPTTISKPNNMHNKTLDFIFQLPTKDLAFESPIPFPSLEKLSTSQFFELFAERTEAKLDQLARVTMTPAFGHQQSFVVERFGEGMGSKWEKVKGRLKTMWMQQIKREPENDDFEIWVEVEG